MFVCTGAPDTAYIVSFGVSHIPKKVNKFIGNLNTLGFIFRMQVYRSVMFGFSYNVVVDFLFNNQSLISRKIINKYIK